MTTGKLAIRAGVNTNATQTQNAGGWSICNLIRWKNGFLEKIGGWARLFNQPAAGYVRAIHAFEDLQTNLNLGLGTDGGLQIYSGSALYDVTFANQSQIKPVVTVGGAGGIIVTNGSSVFTVTDTTYRPTIGQSVIFPVTFVSGNRIRFGGTSATVASTPTSTTWTYINDSAASSASNGPAPPRFITTSGSSIVRVGFGTSSIDNHSWSPGEAFVVQQSVIPEVSTDTINIPPGSYPITTIFGSTVFEIQTGIVQTQSSAGWEGSTFTGYPVIYGSQNLPVIPANWYLDNLGSNMTVSYTNSSLYIWSPPVSLSATAALVTQAPSILAGSFVAMPQAQIIAFGASALGIQDPLLLAWSDAGTYDVWTATSANQAGTYRLSRGSRIVGGLQAPQTTLIWTDTDLWSMQYNGPPFVYGFTIVGTGCGLISPKARAAIGGITFWMGRDGFWRYDGASVTPLPCDVWDVVFNDIDRDNVNKCHAGASSSFQDMYFYYPSLSGGGEIDSYVKVNFSTGTPLWDYGKLARTAWIDNNVFGPPMGADANFRIQQHETGYDNDDQPMTGSYAETGMFDVGDGSDILSIQQIQPDCKFFGANGYNMLTLWSQNYAGGSVRMSGPYPMTPTTQYVSPRVRARQMALRIDLCPVKGTSVRMGAFRVKSQPAGKQP